MTSTGHSLRALPPRLRDLRRQPARFRSRRYPRPAEEPVR